MSHEHEKIEHLERLILHRIEELQEHLKHAIHHRLAEMECKLMSKISEFAERQNQFNNQLDTAVEDLQGDVTNLNAQIKALQDSAGGITPEDQALLDAIEARSGNIATKLAALAAQTPPVPPTA